MIKAFFYSRKWFLWAYLGGAFLLLSLYAQVQMSVLFNEWYKDFYNLLQNATQHEISEFWDSITTFIKIAIPYVFLATITSFFTSIYAFRWREAITFNYLPRWKNVKKDIEGSSQRIQEDTYRFTRIVESLGLAIMKALMTLIAFIPILWGLSSEIELPHFGVKTGSLVIIAIATSVGGLAISWLVGWFLPKLEYNNQVVEAKFRKELVLGEDNKVDYCGMNIMHTLFKELKYNYHRLFFHYGYFDLWSNTYNQIMVIVPFLVSCPTLFSGGISLGVLMQVSNSFSEVRESCSLLIYRWKTITELRSIHLRLKEFEEVLDEKL